MDTEEKKLTSSEIDEMLKEMEEYHQPIRKTNKNRKKKPKIRIDMIIAAIVIVALVVGAVVLISHFTKQAGKSTSKTSTDNPLMDEKYPEISDVVKNYLDAYLIEDSEQRMSVLAQYVDNMGDISDISQKDYIAGYSDVECYTKEGPYENTYVVYAYYQMELKNIATKVPSIDRLYVIRDSNTGNVYIHNGVSSDIKAYMEEVTADEDVQELFEEVNQEYQEALESDEQLKAYFSKLQPETTAETETEAAETGEAAETTQTAETTSAAQ